MLIRRADYLSKLSAAKIFCFLPFKAQQSFDYLELNLDLSEIVVTILMDASDS